MNKSGAVKLNLKTKTNPLQMTNKWIDKVADELLKKGGNKEKLGDLIKTNPEIIDKFVVAVDKINETLDVIAVND